MSVEQQVATGRVTAGVDWASHAHAVALVDGDGVQSQRFTVAHTATELQQMVQRLRRAGVAEVAIERPDGPVVDALLAAGLTVFVIAPNQVKNLRGRYGSAGNKDDRFDAFVLADTLRTDLARLRPLTPDSEATISLRMTVRARKGLVAARVAMANQLRAHLQSTLPGVIVAAVGHRLAPSRVDLSLPRWDFGSNINHLLDPLAKLGLTDLGNFGGISDAGLLVTNAAHRANITVDEHGTEAAAVTGIGADSGPIPFRADRPFAFAIVHGPTITPLSIGHVADPADTAG